MTSESLESLRRPDNRSARSRRLPAGAWIIPSMVLAFIALAALLFGDSLRPATEVDTAPVLLLPAEAGGSPAPSAAPDVAATLLFQASGWIEPDPHPVRVAAKTAGYVDEVFALEGATVRAGQLLATLDDSDARLGAARAIAGLQQAEADYAAHLASLPAAGAAVRRAEAERTAAIARRTEADDRWRRMDGLAPGDASTDERNLARRERDTAAAAAEAAEAAAAEARGQLEALRAASAARAAAVEAARAMRDEANLTLSRTRIHAPSDGVVLRRFASPGVKRMAEMDDPESATIVQLFDPARLQARVDVPLAEAGRVVTGQMVRITVALLPDRAFTARVTRITGEADFQRNTLQVKAALDAPDPRLRPEMLCRAEFLGPGGTDSRPGGAAPTHRPWVRESALLGLEGERAVAWVVDPVRHTASPRDVRVGSERRDGHRPVLEGLREGERTLIDPRPDLRPGGRVRERRGDGEP